MTRSPVTAARPETVVDAALAEAIWDGPELVSIHRRDAAILAVNAAFAAFIGRRADELVGLDYYDLVHPDDRLALSREHARHLERAGGTAIVHRLADAAGAWRTIETVPYLLPDARFVAIARERGADDAVRAAATPALPDTQGARGGFAASPGEEDGTGARPVRLDPDVFALTFEAAATGKAIIDRDRRIVATNDALGRILGRSQDELLRLRLGDLVDEADLERVLAGVRRLEPRGAALNDSVRMRTASGTELVCDLAIVALDGRPRPRHFVVEVLDISRAATAERRAADADAGLNAVLRASSDAVLVLDAEEHVVDCNDAFVRLLGWQRDEALGRDVRELGIWEDARRRTRLRELAGRTSSLADFDAVWRDRDGARRDVVLSAQRLDYRGTRALLVTARDVTERRRAEQALAESEERFRALATSAPVGILRAAPDGACVYVNPRWVELAGITSERAMADGWLAAVHPNDRDRVRRDWKAAVAGRRRFAGDFRFRRPDGSERWVSGSASPIVGPDGGATGHIGIVEDISDRMRAQLALRASEERFRRLFEDLPVGAVLYDASGSILAANRAAQRILMPGQGGVLVDGTGRRVAAARHPAVRAAATARPVSDEILGLRFPGGERRWLLVNAVPWPREDGEVHVLVSYIDLTERRDAEQAIARLAELIDLATDAIIVRDASGRIESWNGGATAMFGWTAAEAVGRDIDDLLRPEYPVRPREVTRALAASGSWEGEVVHVARDGRRMVSMSRQAVRRGPRGTIERILEIDHDVTERKEAEAAAVREEARSATVRERERLAREIHDGLAQRLWYAQLRQETVVAHADLAPAALTAAEEAAAAIEQALADARAAVLASRSPGAEGSSFEELLREIVGERTIPHGIASRVDVRALPELTPREQSELLGIAQEALNNVAKHAGAGRVEVLVTARAGTVSLTVRDDGRGFAARDRAGGFGLGSMRQRAALIGARVRVTSRPGRGTSVRVSLPPDGREDRTGDDHSA